MNEHTRELVDAFKITEADVEANRAGKLGATQARHLRKSGLANLFGALVCGVILALILAFVVHKPLKPAQWITALILFLAVLAVGINDLRKTGAAAAAGTVEKLAGPIQVQSRGKQGFWLRVSGRDFRMPVHPWKLKNGEPYVVYFTPLGNRVVGMEPMS